MVRSPTVRSPTVRVLSKVGTAAATTLGSMNRELVVDFVVESFINIVGALEAELLSFALAHDVRKDKRVEGSMCIQ